MTASYKNITEKAVRSIGTGFGRSLVNSTLSPHSQLQTGSSETEFQVSE